MKKFKSLGIAPWAKAEQRKKIRAEQRTEFFLKVRLVFVLLFVVTVFVFVQNHQALVQQFASSKLYQIMKKSSTSEKLREKALDYQNEVNQASH
ncbi:MAG: hypothetical protein ACREFE_02630 [Limisphaerales bacterium]